MASSHANYMNLTYGLKSFEVVIKGILRLNCHDYGTDPGKYSDNAT